MILPENLDRCKKIADGEGQNLKKMSPETKKFRPETAKPGKEGFPPAVPPSFSCFPRRKGGDETPGWGIFPETARWPFVPDALLTRFGKHITV
jgi:hypothetical protein